MNSLVLNAPALSRRGSSSLIPNYQRPPFPLVSDPATGSAYVPNPEVYKTTVIPDSQHSFCDPVLAQLIEQLFSNNRDLRVAALIIEACEAQSLMQLNDWQPETSIVGSGGQQSLPIDKLLLDEQAISGTCSLSLGSSVEVRSPYNRHCSLAKENLKIYFYREHTLKTYEQSLEVTSLQRSSRKTIVNIDATDNSFPRCVPLNARPTGHRGLNRPRLLLSDG